MRMGASKGSGELGGADAGVPSLPPTVHPQSCEMALLQGGWGRVAGALHKDMRLGMQGWKSSGLQ